MKKPIINRSWYYPLFEHMDAAHGLTLTESEMADIIVVVDKMREENGTAFRPSSPIWWANTYEDGGITGILYGSRKAARDHAMTTKVKQVKVRVIPA